THEVAPATHYLVHPLTWLTPVMTGWAGGRNRAGRGPADPGCMGPGSRAGTPPLRGSVLPSCGCALRYSSGCRRRPGWQTLGDHLPRGHPSDQAMTSDLVTFRLMGPWRVCASNSSMRFSTSSIPDIVVPNWLSRW